MDRSRIINRLPAAELAMWDFGEWPLLQRKGQRYGQAFLNTFFPEVTDSELFYCETISEAKAIIAKNYLTT